MDTAYTEQTSHANGIDIHGDDSLEAGKIVHQEEISKKSDEQKIAFIELAAYLDEYICETRIKIHEQGARLSMNFIF